MFLYPWDPEGDDAWAAALTGHDIAVARRAADDPDEAQDPAT